MNWRVLSAIGALIGAVLGYLTVKRFARTAAATIHVSDGKGQCTSRTYPGTLRVTRNTEIEWVIHDPHDCLGDAALEFRFEREDSPLTRRRPKGKGRIKDKTRGNARLGRYKYSVWYVGDDGTEYEMEDPEIELEL